MMTSLQAAKEIKKCGRNERRARKAKKYRKRAMPVAAKIGREDHIGGLGDLKTA